MTWRCTSKENLQVPALWPCETDGPQYSSVFTCYNHTKHFLKRLSRHLTSDTEFIGFHWSQLGIKDSLDVTVYIEEMLIGTLILKFAHEKKYQNEIICSTST